MNEIVPIIKPITTVCKNELAKLSPIEEIYLTAYVKTQNDLQLTYRIKIEKVNVMEQSMLILGLVDGATAMFVKTFNPEIIFMEKSYKNFYFMAGDLYTQDGLVKGKRVMIQLHDNQLRIE